MTKFVRSALSVVALVGLTTPLAAVRPSASGDSSNSELMRFSGLEWEVDDPQAALVERDGVGVLSMGSGSAWLAGRSLSTGVIEVDIWPRSGTAFAGIGFHAQDLENLELVYLRMHRSGSWDAVQYCPRFNAVDGWQLYTGEPFTAAASWEVDEPVRLRLEVGERTVRVFVGEHASEPLLTAPLKHSASDDGIMLWSRIGNQFSNFRIVEQPMDEVGGLGEAAGDAAPSEAEDWQPLKRWEISESIDAATFPRAPKSLDDLPPGSGWLAVETEPDGLLNISRWRGKRVLGRRPTNNSEDAVIARTIIRATSAENRVLRLGFSDDVWVFLNGEAVFAGDGGFRSRHPTYLGLVTSNDFLYLDLHHGENELVIVTSELFGGWGFRAELQSQKAN